MDIGQIFAFHHQLLFAVKAVLHPLVAAVAAAGFLISGLHRGRERLDFGRAKAVLLQKFGQHRLRTFQAVEHFLISCAVRNHAGLPFGAIGLIRLFSQAFHRDGAGLAEVFKLSAQHESSGNQADGQGDAQ